MRNECQYSLTILSESIMGFFHSRFYCVNKNYLYCYGQWPLQKLRSRFIFGLTSITLIASLVIPKVIRFIELFGDINAMIHALPVLALHAVSIVKFCNCSINSKKMRALTLRIKEDWIAQNCAKETDTILSRFAQRGRVLTVGWTGYVWMTLWMYLLLPSIPILLDVIAPLNQSRDLIYLYDTEYFVDPNEYYYYILVHAYISMPVSIGMMIAYDTMFAVYVQHACGMLATVGERLRSIGRDDHDKIIRPSTCIRHTDSNYQKIVTCIKMHNNAVNFVGLLESTNSWCFLFINGLSMLMIAMTGVMTMTSLSLREPGETLRIGTFAIGEIVYLFFFCWQGQVLMDHSENVFLDAYSVNWYNMSGPAKKLLIVLMMRSLVPCKITAGQLYALSMENFSTILKTSWSYFTVLGSIK